MAFWNWKNVVALCTLGSVACASAIDQENVPRRLEELTRECIGQIRSGSLLILGPDDASKAHSIEGASGLELGKLSRDGNVLVGWNRTGITYAKHGERRVLKGIRLDAPVLDLSIDGSRLALIGTDQSRDLSGLLLLDSQGLSVERVSQAGYSPSLSPSGDSVAFLEDSKIRIVGKAEALQASVPAAGTLPGWSPDGQELSVLLADRYQIIDVRTRKSKTISARGTPLTSLQWSSNGLAGMYVTRTTSDYWSLSCTERYHIVVVDMKSGTDFIYHAGCSSYPERAQWLSSSACPSFGGK